MGKVIIHFRYNKLTGQKDLCIEYSSESDSLPYEHEKRHREIVSQLLGQQISAIRFSRTGPVTTEPSTQQDHSVNQATASNELKQKDTD